MKPMMAWCYYCERHIIWQPYKREWVTLKAWNAMDVRLCPLSGDCYHHPVPAKTDVLRKVKR